MAFIVKPSQACAIKDLPRAGFPFGREILLWPHVFFKKPSQAEGPLHMIFDSLKEKDGVSKLRGSVSLNLTSSPKVGVKGDGKVCIIYHFRAQNSSQNRGD